ncbi:gluconate 5-dehydrogenase [Diplodia corticola]|uniref:Gluconate 5-dehydrogenase n=1 Tax=Diplodia corticola TaxID=236234 RepID=A0A1J9SKS7_9PEZI|nr:gluconate 5-dehydrogenase [Diplodia corticola]OJD40340.1 gluconate 5-dehydrogenase [Diplodia corticola]
MPPPPQAPAPAPAPAPGTRRLQGRVALVTGSSSGFGREICKQFALEGAAGILCADLVPGARSTANAEDDGVPTHELVQREEYGGGATKALFVKVDVSKAVDVKGAIARAVEEWGRVDIVVNNAGICGEAANPAPIDESNEDMFDAHLAINTKGAYLGCKYAVQQMKTQEPHASGIRGWIVNVASLGATVGIPGLVCYNASKGAIVSLTKTVAVDVGQFGITCNAICPGSSYGTMLDEALQGAFSSIGHDAIASMYPLKRIGRPIDQARSVCYLASDDAAWVTGTTLAVDGGMSAQ